MSNNNNKLCYSCIHLDRLLSLRSVSLIFDTKNKYPPQFPDNLNFVGFALKTENTLTNHVALNATSVTISASSSAEHFLQKRIINGYYSFSDKNTVSKPTSLSQSSKLFSASGMFREKYFRLFFVKSNSPNSKKVIPIILFQGHQV